MRYPTPEEGHVRAAARCRRPPSLTSHAARFHAGRPPRNKGMCYPADPPTSRRSSPSCATPVTASRPPLARLIVVFWRAGLRISEALALAEADLDARRGSILVRRGKGGNRREVGMDHWGWEQLAPGWRHRVELPVGPLFCVIDGPTRGRPWAAAAARAELRRLAARGRSTPPLRAASAAPRPRRRDGARGRAAERHPAPARPHATSASPPSTCKASTTPRSSTPSTPARARWSRSTARSGSDLRLRATEGSRHPSVARPGPTEQPTALLLSARAAPCRRKRRRGQVAWERSLSSLELA